MSRIIALPTDWASNTNYATGPDVGTATKVDPGVHADGYIRGVLAAPQEVNYVINRQSLAMRRAVQVAALALRELDAVFTDTAEAMGATMVDGIAAPGNGVVCIKSDVTDTKLAYDDPSVDVQGSVASITSAVRDAATNGTRIVAIGTGGNVNSYSDNAGGSWSAGGAGISSSVPTHIVYSPHYDGFLVGGNAGSVSRSLTAAAVWTSAASGFAAVLGLAVLGDTAGTIFALGNSGIEPRFSRSTNDGSSFTGSTAPPNAATAEEPGDLAGCPLVTRDSLSLHAYHVMRCNAGARLRTALSPGGTVWVAGVTIEAPAGSSFSAAPRLMICQSSGLMVIAVPLDTGVTALYASLDFTDWVGPALVKDIVVTAFAVAGGRLFMTRDDALYASDGVGNL